MMHDHDALTWMYPEESEDEIIPYLTASHHKPFPSKTTAH